MKSLSILGSTGSIGLSALKVIDSHPERYRVVGLAAGKNVDLLVQQAERYRPRAVAALERGSAEKIRQRVKGKIALEVFHGTEGFKRLATLEDADTLVSAMSGAAGLVPTVAGIEAGKHIALANKETLVMAGPLVMDEARRRGVSILPVDSEHSAIFQSLLGHPREDLRRIIITASGGPFRGLSQEEMAAVTPEQALRHPTWNMGRKITVDSATLMNKGLEVIEAKWLFGLRMDQISVLIHPQSVVHSMVEYVDGSIIAQMGIPDMITPISYALSFPRHVDTYLPPLKLEEAGALQFFSPDKKKFPCLELAFRAAEEGGSMPAVLNAANEVAVGLFLKGGVGFLQIPLLVEKTMDAHETLPIDTIEAVLRADAWARRAALDLAGA
ncbi:MAG: 1-deoxy-D-xylulose-5-phosphate reductoisomerase [Thermodesulfobacteriota bacterium]